MIDYPSDGSGLLGTHLLLPNLYFGQSQVNIGVIDIE